MECLVFNKTSLLSRPVVFLEFKKIQIATCWNVLSFLMSEVEEG